MELEEWDNHLKESNAPNAISHLQQAVWYLEKGEWEKAHTIVQSIYTPEAAWLHGYIHRIEGDIYNAKYWYKQASLAYPVLSLEEELKEIVNDIVL